MATAYGFDTSVTLRTVALEQPDGSTLLVTAVQPDLRMSTSTGRTHLAEALVCRLMTPRGQLPDVVIQSTTANYGFSLQAAVNDDMTARELGQFGANVSGEAEKDERVNAATCDPVLAGNVLMVPIAVTDARGPFLLVLGVSNVSVTVLSSPK